MFNVTTDPGYASYTVKTIMRDNLKSLGYVNGQAKLTAYKCIDDSDQCGQSETLKCETMDGKKWIACFDHNSGREAYFAEEVK